MASHIYNTQKAETGMGRQAGRGGGGGKKRATVIKMEIWATVPGYNMLDIQKAVLPCPVTKLPHWTSKKLCYPVLGQNCRRCTFDDPDHVAFLCMWLFWEPFTQSYALQFWKSEENNVGDCLWTSAMMSVSCVKMTLLRETSRNVEEEDDGGKSLQKIFFLLVFVVVFWFLFLLVGFWFLLFLKGGLWGRETKK